VHRDLPPLSLLLTFDAAARAGSFKEAARQLCVTPSAVSQQIRALEKHLSVELFERTPRTVQLNDMGCEYAKVVAAALELLGSGTRRLRRPGERRCVRISADPFFASDIVIPLLPSMQRDHPELEVCVESNQTIVDLRAQSCRISPTTR
jgi:LysR family glycine cleavage system transcriptional activator